MRFRSSGLNSHLPAHDGRMRACAGGANLQLSTRDEQLDVLAKVLAAGEEEAGVEVADVTDDVARTKKALAQRTAVSLAALSGAHGLTYMEVCAASWQPRAAALVAKDSEPGGHRI